MISHFYFYPVSIPFGAARAPSPSPSFSSQTLFLFPPFRTVIKLVLLRRGREGGRVSGGESGSGSEMEAPAERSEPRFTKIGSYFLSSCLAFQKQFIRDETTTFPPTAGAARRHTCTFCSLRKNRSSHFPLHDWIIGKLRGRERERKTKGCEEEAFSPFCVHKVIFAAHLSRP